MYAGHFAVGLAIKSRFSHVPTFPIMLGVGMLDILNGIFIITGIDRVTPNLSAGPYLFFDLNWIDWDHSLLMAIIWSLVWGAIFMKNKTVAMIAAAVFSHFIIDVPVHNNDLALYPFSTYHMGFGLWGSLGIYSWLLEGVFCLVLLAYAWRESNRIGISLLWPALFLAILFIQLSPWLSPMRVVAHMSEPYAHFIHGVLVMMGFMVPSLIMIWLINRNNKGSEFVAQPQHPRGRADARR